MYFRYTWLTGYIIGAAYAVWAKVKRNNKTVHAVNWLATSGYDDVKYWSAETMFSQVVDCSRLQDSRHYWIGRDNKTRWGRDEIGRWILRFIFAVTSNIRWGPSTIWQRGINYSNSRATGEKTRARADSRNQGGKRLGDETNSPLFKRCVMRRSTGTSALSALPVRLVAGKTYLSTNRKSHFLSLFFSQPRTMIKTFFHSPGLQVKMFMSGCILVNLLHSKLAKNELNLRVPNACSCRKTWHGFLSLSLLQKLLITPP